MKTLYRVIYFIFHSVALRFGMWIRLTRIEIGTKSRIYSNVFVKYPHHITIGKNTFINYECILWAAPKSYIRIGNDVVFGPRVSLIASNHGLQRDGLIRENTWEDADITVEDDVWIGANAVVLAGTKIGHGAVIAAGAIVNKNVEPFDIMGGIPAKRIGSRSSNSYKV
jgi:maltose O-acetyltransferase